MGFALVIPVVSLFSYVSWVRLNLSVDGEEQSRKKVLAFYYRYEIGVTHSN